MQNRLKFFIKTNKRLKIWTTILVFIGLPSTSHKASPINIVDNRTNTEWQTEDINNAVDFINSSHNTTIQTKIKYKFCMVSRRFVEEDKIGLFKTLAQDFLNSNNINNHLMLLNCLKDEVLAEKPLRKRQELLERLKEKRLLQKLAGEEILNNIIVERKASVNLLKEEIIKEKCLIYYFRRHVQKIQNSYKKVSFRRGLEAIISLLSSKEEPVAGRCLKAAALLFLSKKI